MSIHSIENLRTKNNANEKYKISLKKKVRTFSRLTKLSANFGEFFLNKRLELDNLTLSQKNSLWILTCVCQILAY